MDKRTPNIFCIDFCKHYNQSIKQSNNLFNIFKSICTLDARFCTSAVIEVLKSVPAVTGRLVTL